VGNVALDGGGSVATSGSINISGSGADIWGTNDAFHFGYQVLNGDGSIIARVTGVENVDPWAKAGLMIRESLASNAKNAFMFVSAQNGTWMQQRTTTGDATTTTDAANLPAGPAWLKLTRTGSTLVGYQSTDGVNWSQVGSASINMSSAVLVGLAITSHKVDDRATAFMDNVSISTTGGTVSAPSAGLLARWRFNEAAGNTASDSTANPANVTLNRGASFKVGRAGNSIYLDGVDDVGVIGQPTKLKISGKITLGAWIKPERSDGLRSIITHGWDSAKKSVYLRINNGFYQVGVWNGGGADIVAQFKVPSGDLNTWVHVAGTFDGSKWRLYRNGPEVASTTSSVGAPVVNDNWLIGASKGTGLGEFFTGHIDDATIYNRALSGSEIKTLMV